MKLEIQKKFLKWNEIIWFIHIGKILIQPIYLKILMKRKEKNNFLNDADFLIWT
jgi:hypothetical protein